MRTYQITCSDDSQLSLPSNAHIVDSEYADGCTVVAVEVEGNYTRFEQTLDTTPCVISYEYEEAMNDEPELTAPDGSKEQL